MPSIVQDRGIIDLPIAYLGMAVFSLPTAFGMLALIRVMGPRRSRIVALLASSALLAVCWQVARPGSGLRMTAIFIGVPLVFGVRGALRVAQGGLKASIHRANWEQAFIPAVPNAPRPNSSWTAWKHPSERA